MAAGGEGDGLSLTVPKCVFIDCDGVIMDSNHHKTGAYADVLREMKVPDAAIEQFLQLHLSDVSVSRFVKFERFFTTMHKVDDAGAATARALELFGEMALRVYDRLEPVAEAVAFARACPSIHVVSGGKQAELRTVFAAKGIDQHFQGIYGSPTTKPEHVRRLMAELEVGPAECVFIGDGLTDYRTSKELDIPFVFLEAMSDWADARATIAAGGYGDCTLCRTWADALAHFSAVEGGGPA